MRIVKILFWITIISLITAFVSIQLISNKINFILYRYTSAEVERFTTTLINYSIDEDVINQIESNIYNLNKNKADEVETIDFDTKKVNKVLNTIEKKIQKNLLDIENGNIKNMNFSDTFTSKRFKDVKKGIICEIPMGSLLSNSVFSNVGVVIPIRIVYIGQVVTNLTTNLKSYGINNLYLEMNAHIEVKARIIMPMFTKDKQIETDVPLIIKIIKGNIPNYYQGSLYSNSNENLIPIN